MSAKTPAAASHDQFETRSQIPPSSQAGSRSQPQQPSRSSQAQEPTWEQLPGAMPWIPPQRSPTSSPQQMRSEPVQQAEVQREAVSSKKQEAQVDMQIATNFLSFDPDSHQTASPKIHSGASRTGEGRTATSSTPKQESQVDMQVATSFLSFGPGNQQTASPEMLSETSRTGIGRTVTFGAPESGQGTGKGKERAKPKESEGTWEPESVLGATNWLLSQSGAQQSPSRPIGHEPVRRREDQTLGVGAVTTFQEPSPADFETVNEEDPRRTGSIELVSAQGAANRRLRKDWGRLPEEKPQGESQGEPRGKLKGVLTKAKKALKSSKKGDGKNA